ncbi:hypothetical protein L665_03070 [Ralstonia solanacearum SD54]|nr:hypothetical protein F504_1326 [Ralstonia pseudosolanacearum FQY_4]ESS47510.1 hypothetical protein L665_03070 [Ralstonia solanacearum SD54]
MTRAKNGGRKAARGITQHSSMLQCATDDMSTRKPRTILKW